MNTRRGPGYGSLGFRLLPPLSVTIALVLTVYASLSFDATRQQVRQQMYREAQRASALIQGATLNGMLLNRFDEVQIIVDRMVESPDLAALRLYDKVGEVVISADRAEIGTTVALDAQPCLACHRENEPLTGADFEEVRLPGEHVDEGALRYLTVIRNQPGCSSVACHGSPAEEPVLGILDFEVSMAALEENIDAARTRLVWTTVVLLLVVVLVTTEFFRRVVLRPVDVLRRATESIAAGQLDTRIQISGDHELAQLGSSFNQMAGDLELARAQLQQWSRSLEDKVREKSEELRHAEQHVQQTEKMASLGRLCATVAHEINNPLSGMLTYARLGERTLAGQGLTEPQREQLSRHLQLIQKECTRCGDIVKNLLLFARRRGAEMVETDVNTVVDRSLTLVRHHLEMADVALVHQPLDGDPKLIVDGGQLQQCLVDLFVNAAEAMNSGGHQGGQLRVMVSGDRHEVRIEVGDTGGGIAPDVLPHVFEPFFSTKGDASGVGLGLAVVYGIVRRHGGDISVASELGVGTTFQIRLPRVPQVGQAEERVT